MTAAQEPHGRLHGAARARRLAAAACLTALVCGLACREPRRPIRPPGSALWIGATSRELRLADWAALRRAGVGELFVEVGRLGWTGGEPAIEDRPLPAVPRGARVTLVAVGELPGSEIDGEVAAEALARDLDRLTRSAENRGWQVVGLHLDLRAGVEERAENLDAYAGLLRALRKRLGPRLLSATVDPSWLTEPPGAAAKLGEAADFLACFAFGRRGDGRRDAWDLDASRRILELLSAAGQRHLAGVVTLGEASLVDAGGAVRERSTAIHLARLATEPALRLAYGRTLQAPNHRLYEFVAERPAEAGAWHLERGNSVRIERLAAADLESYLALRQRGSRHHLGELFFRLPEPEDRLSLELEELLAALAPGPATPQIDVQVEAVRRGAVTVAVRNRGPGGTELSLLDHNFVELRLARGSFGAVDPGGFQRYRLLRSLPGAPPEPTLRRPDVLRLHVPLVSAGERVASGRIALRGPGAAAGLEVQGRFLLPDGRVLEVAAQR